MSILFDSLNAITFLENKSRITQRYISETEKHFYESSLYIDQPLDNVYGKSKFEAEKAVLDAMTDGLQANIMRMGNLTNRYSDGVFQKNHESNAAAKRIKSVLELGMIPDYLMDIYCEFTAIDEAARAVMNIVRHFSTVQTVFHINSVKVVYLDTRQNHLQNYFPKRSRLKYESAGHRIPCKSQSSVLSFRHWLRKNTCMSHNALHLLHN